MGLVGARCHCTFMEWVTENWAVEHMNQTAEWLRVLGLDFFFILFKLVYLDLLMGFPKQEDL